MFAADVGILAPISLSLSFDEERISLCLFLLYGGASFLGCLFIGSMNEKR